MREMLLKEKRPVGVWIICGLFALGLMNAGIQALVHLFEAIPSRLNHRQILDAVTFAQSLMAAVTLFQLKKSAVRWFALGPFLLIFNFSVFYFYEGLSDLMVSVAAFGFVVNAALYFYVRRLSQTGVLTPEGLTSRTRGEV